MGNLMARTTKSTARALSGAARRSGNSKAMRSVHDGLKNVLSGMGTEKDKTFSTMFGFMAIDRAQLDAAYRGDWIARKGVDIPAFDTTREWRTWQADLDDVTTIEDVEKKFRVQLKVMRAMVLGRLYGGGALIMGVKGNPEQPLDPLTVDTDGLEFLHCLSRFDLATGPINWDITSPWYGRPEWYSPSQNNGNVSSTVKLHPSRVVTFLGNEIPDPMMAQGWGDSVLQMASDAIIGAGTTLSSITQLVAEAKLDVIKIPGLSENIMNEEYEARLTKRFQFANMAKGVFSMILLDKEEEWERIDAQFAGLPDVEKVALLIASGAFDVPATRFLSQSPQGLNATGDSDTRNYYDRISTEQKVFVSPNLDVLDQVLLRSALGTVPEDEYKDMFYEWNPLWQLSDKEKAEVAKSKADTFKVDVDAGLLNDVVLKKAREAQLIADGTYPGLAQIIDEFDDDPELEQANAEAAMLMQGAPITDPNDPNYDPTKDPNSPQFVKPKQVANAQGKLAPPKAQPQKALPPPSKKEAAAVDGLVRRISDASRPRSLYVRRDLLNSADLVKWARKQGFGSIVPDLHVTIMYSKQPVDWLKIGADEFRSEPDGGLTVKPGGPRVMEKFGRAVVLGFASSDLQYRHRSMMYRGEEDGITWEHDDYTPHVTITYDAGAMNIDEVEAYTGELRFGPEIFEEITVGFNPDTLKEKALDGAPRPAPEPAPAPASPTRARVTKRDKRGRPDEMVSSEGGVTKRVRVVSRDAAGRPEELETTVIKQPETE